MGFSSWPVKQSCTALAGDHRWAGVWKPSLDWWPQNALHIHREEGPLPVSLPALSSSHVFPYFQYFLSGTRIEIGRDNVTPTLNDAHSGWWAAGPPPLLALV